MLELHPLQRRDRTYEAMKRLYEAVHKTLSDEREEIVDRHATYDGWTGYVAAVDETFVGYVYGHHSRPGQWWHDLLVEQRSRSRRDRWLEDAFAVVEIGVLSEYRRRGIASELLETVLRDVDHATALLTVGAENEGAQRFYRDRGWTVVDDRITFPQGEYHLMGLALSNE